MPNLPNRGVIGRPDEGAGAGLAMVDGVASLVGSTVPRPILQMFATGPSGAPVLVWSRDPVAVTGVSRTFVDPTSVQVSWTLTANVEADTWEVRRPDGSLVGSVTWDGIAALVQTLLDLSPIPNAVTVNAATAAKRGGAASGLPTAYPAATGAGRVPIATITAPSGTVVYADGSVWDSLGWQDGTPAAANSAATYTVVAKLGGLPAAAGSAPSLDLTLPVRSLSTNVVSNPGSVILNWLTPTYGNPDGYEVWRNGVLVVSQSFTLLSYNDANPNRGIVNEYSVIPLMSGLGGRSQNIQQAIPAAAPLQGSLTYSTLPGFPGIYQVSFTWADGPGAHTGYEVYFIDNGVDGSHTTVGPTTHAASTPGVSGHQYYGRVRALGVGGDSSYSGLGPLTIP